MPALAWRRAAPKTQASPNASVDLTMYLFIVDIGSPEATQSLAVKQPNPSNVAHSRDRSFVPFLFQVTANAASLSLLHGHGFRLFGTDSSFLVCSQDARSAA